MCPCIHIHSAQVHPCRALQHPRLGAWCWCWCCRHSSGERCGSATGCTLTPTSFYLTFSCRGLHCSKARLRTRQRRSTCLSDGSSLAVDLICWQRQQLSISDLLPSHARALTGPQSLAASATMDAAVQRALNDKLYDKRKVGALESASSSFSPSRSCACSCSSSSDVVYHSDIGLGLNA